MPEIRADSEWLHAELHSLAKIITIAADAVAITITRSELRKYIKCSRAQKLMYFSTSLSFKLTFHLTHLDYKLKFNVIFINKLAWFHF